MQMQWSICYKPPAYHHCSFVGHTSVLVNANAGCSLFPSGLHRKAWHSAQTRFPGKSPNLNHTFSVCLLMKHTDYTITQMQSALVASLHQHKHTDSQANLLSQLCTRFHNLPSSWTLQSICECHNSGFDQVASLSVHMHMHKTCMASP